MAPYQPTQTRSTVGMLAEPVDPIAYIGSGSYGMLERVRRWDGRIFARKTLRDGVHCRNRFLLELRIIAAVNHPNVVAYAGCVLSTSAPSIIMEYCSRGTLQNYIANETISWPSVRRIARQLCAGMHACHTSPMGTILHRDLVANNVLFDGGGNVRICDFGLSRVVPHGASVTRSSSDDDDDDYAVGCHRCRAPEIWKGRDYGSGIDVWAIGVLVCTLACGGRHPFWGSTLKEIKIRVLKDARRAPLLHDCPDDIQSFIDAALTQDADNRPGLPELLETLDNDSSNVAAEGEDAEEAARDEEIPEDIFVRVVSQMLNGFRKRRADEIAQGHFVTGCGGLAADAVEFFLTVMATKRWRAHAGKCTPQQKALSGAVLEFYDMGLLGGDRVGWLALSGGYVNVLRPDEPAPRCGTLPPERFGSEWPPKGPKNCPKKTEARQEISKCLAEISAQHSEKKKRRMVHDMFADMHAKDYWLVLSGDAIFRETVHRKMHELAVEMPASMMYFHRMFFGDEPEVCERVVIDTL